MRIMSTLAIHLLITSFGFAVTIHVPGDFTKIQEAIDAAVIGDTVLVQPGTYMENIDFSGKAITVVSDQGAGVTIIDGNQNGSVVTCQSGEDENSVLKGFTITNGTGTLLNSSFYYGGGMCNSSSNPTVTHCTFTGNTADNGGGMAIYYSSSPTVTQCIFSGNGASSDGGGMINLGSSTTVTNCAFSGNSAGLGGGMYNLSSSTTVTDCTFSENSAYHGGGMFNRGYGSSPKVIHCTFSKNGAANYGGGMYNLGSNPTVSHNTFSGNWATFDGGGIYNTESSPTAIQTVTQCNFNENKASSGGGIYCEYGSSIVIDCSFECNLAWEGGGIYCPTKTILMVNNCTYSGNSADNGGGVWIGHAVQPDISMVTNSTLTGNGAATAGGGIYNEGGITAVTNCVLLGNSADGYGGGIRCGGPSFYISNTIIRENYALSGPEIEGFPIVINSNIKGDWPGVGNIDAEPLFVEPGYWDDNGTPGIPGDDFWVDGDYHLTFSSPCRDSGTKAAQGLPLYDFEGDPRINYDTVDMGPDEFYTHLYWTGDATPGGNVALKFTALPGTSPVQLWLGSGVMDPPWPTKFGDWHLEFPMLADVVLGSIPSPDGVLIFPFTFPLDTPIPLSLPLQAGIGQELTNLSLIEVK